MAICRKSEKPSDTLPNGGFGQFLIGLNKNTRGLANEVRGTRKISDRILPFMFKALPPLPSSIILINLT